MKRVGLNHNSSRIHRRLLGCTLGGAPQLVTVVGNDGGLVRFVGVDPSGSCPHELPSAVVPQRSATLAPLAAHGLVGEAWDQRLRRGLRAERRAARGLPTACEPLRRLL
jgi:hypothetical protein